MDKIKQAVTGFKVTRQALLPATCCREVKLCIGAYIISTILQCHAVLSGARQFPAAVLLEC